jgi:uncharacterized protein (TIGR01244 family)
MKNTIAITLLSVLALSAVACQATDSSSNSAPAVQEQHAPPPMAAQSLEPYECGSVTRLHTFDGIFLASQPAPADFEQAAMGGIRTVINLRHDSEQPGVDERALVEGLGLNYVHLPWNGVNELTDGVFDRALELLKTQERPILLHCASSNRVGALWLAYRALEDGIPIEGARSEARTVGLKSPAYEAKALDYIARRAN